jgi:hypothetical protein
MGRDVWGRRFRRRRRSLREASVPGGIAAWTPPDELSDDLIDAPLMEKVNIRYHRLRHILSGYPPHPCAVENDSESIGHGWNISCQQPARIKGDRMFTVPAPIDLVASSVHQTATNGAQNSG